MSYVPTTEQAADILTKGLSRPLFQKLVDKLGMYNLYSPTWGGVWTNLDKSGTIYGNFLGQRNMLGLYLLY